MARSQNVTQRSELQITVAVFSSWFLDSEIAPCLLLPSVIMLRVFFGRIHFHPINLKNIFQVLNSDCVRAI
jgi:hypothetical protein